MNVTRRQFLQRTGAATAGALLGPGLFAHPLVRSAMADTIGDRYFIVLFLDGGNDGQNTVIPRSNGSANLRTLYDGYRRTGGGGIAVPAAALAATAIGNCPGTGAQLGLHPGLAGFGGRPGVGGLKALYDAGKVAVIQGCGYPDYSLSHEESRVIWQTGNPLGVPGLTGTGWGGRHLAHPAYGYGGTQVPAVTIGSSVAPELRQSGTSVLAIDRLEDFGFPYDYDFDDDTATKREAFRRLHQDLAAGDALPSKAYLGASGHATLVSSESYPQLHDLYQADRASWSAQYDGLDRSTGYDLREIAKIIYGSAQGVPNIGARFFALANGGYDTHSDQGAAQPTGQHFGLLAEIGAAIKIFYDDVASMGLAHKVCLLVWSEFARRIPQNDNGTDHGSQGPMFVVGGSVNGGVYGNHPDIANLDWNENTVYRQAPGPHRSTDFRDVYGTILTRWVNMPPAAVAADILPVDTEGPASDYWQTANFNLGFLP
ncbi:MAG: DUF1501 domain-containing protein [bacterium]|nr:DUF1501 domain-containing protein [bacterium]